MDNDSAAKVYPRPEGRFPHARMRCNECGAPPNVIHAKNCPWLLWASRVKVPRG